MRDYIVRVNSPEGQGSGFIVVPSQTSQQVYIITARHCLADRETDIPFELDKLSIDFYREGIWQTYKLTNESKIAMGKSIQHEDIAVVILHTAELPVSVVYEGSPKLGYVPDKSVDSEISGVPNFVLGENIRTLYRLNPLKDSDYVYQVQIEVSDPVTAEYNADSLIDGYSGSPVISFMGEQPLVWAIFHGYEEKTKRVLGIDVVLVNSLLEELGEFPIGISRIETDENIFRAIQSLDTNSRRVLKRVREKIGDITLERTEVRNKLAELINNSKLVIATGKPGVGKSALVKSVIDQLSSQYKVIALQGEQLDKPSIEQIFSLSPFDIRREIEHVLDSPAYSGNKLVLLDSIEKVLETENSDTILDFLDLLNSRRDIKMVMTCRSYAVEQLKMRFLQQYPSFDDYEVIPLGERELEEIGSRYPNIIPMLENGALAKILEIPFNLDKAVMLSESTLGGVSSEKEFSRIMWEYVIENLNHEIKPEVRKKRGEAFMEIAIKRASQMVAFVETDDVEPNILHGLLADNIIDKDSAVANRYAAAHDIYEDWAITRYIESIFYNTVVDRGDYNEFYEKLGTAPAIRRGFRLWFSEKIQNADERINALLKSTLKEEKVSNHWKDEILVAVMRSPYSKRFLNENSPLLFADNFDFFKRILFILKVACKEPDLRHLVWLQGKDRIGLYHNKYLVPFGEGWGSMMSFAYDHLSQLHSQLPVIVSMMLEWEKGLDTTVPFSREAEIAGKILIEYCKAYEFGYSDQFEDRDNLNLKDVIRLLFRLAEVIKAELQTLIENAASYDGDSDNYALRRFYRDIITLVLSGDEDVNICRVFPQLVMDTALGVWLYHSPVIEEEENEEDDSHLGFIKGRRHNRENDFGLKDSGDFSYHPPSPYQTPVYNLLYIRPVLALPFLVKLLNHCGQAFVASDYGINNEFAAIPEERGTITLTFEDGTENVQHASVALWMAYRGTYIATPYLLQSVLMALESFMLSLGKSLKSEDKSPNREGVRGLWELYFDTLLKQSNNVMATSVLLSVAYAYPEFATEKILPLLRIKEFYHWDLLRQVKERSAPGPLGNRYDAKARSRQQRLSDFHGLPHRKVHLGEFVQKLNFGKYREKALELIDHLYALAPTDNEWRMRVSTMDSRKLKIAGKVENGYILETQLEPELKEIADQLKKEAEYTNTLAKTSLYGIQKLNGEAMQEKTYAAWMENYVTLRNIEKPDGQANLYYQPGLIAGVGIRDYADDMNEEQTQWCNATIYEIVYDELSVPVRSYGLSRPTHSSAEVEMAFSVLAKMMHLSEGEEKEELKKFIFVGFIKLTETSARVALESSFHSFLWSADASLAKGCIAGLVQYAALSRYLRRLRSYAPAPISDPEAISAYWLQRNWKKIIAKLTGPKPKEVKIQSYSEIDDKVASAPARWESLLAAVAKGNLVFDFSPLDMEDVSEDFLFEAMKLIPADTTDNELQEYYLKMIDFIFNNLDESGGWGPEKLHYQTVEIFVEQFTKFLLAQDYEVAIKSLKALTDWSFEINPENKFSAKRYEFVERCVEGMINSLILDGLKQDNFWKLWEYLINRCTATSRMPFDEKLLFEKNLYGRGDMIKEGLIGKKHLYESFILNGADLPASARLISGIGFSAFMPEGIRWLEERTRDHWPKEENTVYYFENIVIQSYHNGSMRKSIREIASLRSAFIAILDRLIHNSGSSSAYVIREDFISAKKGITITDDQNN